MSAAVRVGQRLRTTKGDYATVVDVSDWHITVVYQGKRYQRDPSIIGVHLFPEGAMPQQAKKSALPA